MACKSLEDGSEGTFPVLDFHETARSSSTSFAEPPLPGLSCLDIDQNTYQMALYEGTLRAVDGTAVCDHIQRQAPPYLEDDDRHS